MVHSPKAKPVFAGLSITQKAVEFATFSPRNFAIEQCVSLAIPEGVFDADTTMVREPAHLRELIIRAVSDIKPRPREIHLSLPATLLRMAEMPRMETSALYLSLSSEAERYKGFENTEAIVDFVETDRNDLPGNQEQLVFGAVRSDTLSWYLQILKELRIRPASITLEPLNVLRAMAGTGILDSLVQQIGLEAYWGVIFVEPTRMRLSIWQGNRLVELREFQMTTHEFNYATPESLVVEDTLEEIRRTSKNTQPSVWLTHNMPADMEQILSQRLQCPVRPALLGDALAMPQPLHLSTIGCAMTSLLEFPFPFNLLAGLGGRAMTAQGAGASGTLPTEESGASDWLIPAGITSAVIGGLVTAGLFTAASISGAQLPELQARRDALQADVTSLTDRQQQLKKKVDVDTGLLDMVQQGKVRNHVYVALTEDLKEKTPEKIWIRTLKIDNAMEINGKALSHESVITFARSFDSVPYGKAISIKEIKEGKLGGALVYDFTIAGNINLDPTWMDDAADRQAKLESESPNSKIAQSGE